MHIVRVSGLHANVSNVQSSQSCCRCACQGLERHFLLGKCQRLEQPATLARTAGTSPDTRFHITVPVELIVGTWPGTIAADPRVRCILVVLHSYRNLQWKQSCLGIRSEKATCLQNTATIFPEDPALVANEGRAFLQRQHSADAKRLANNLKAKQKTAADRAAKDKTTASMFLPHMLCLQT